MSFMIDGQPAPILIFYAVLELLTIPVALLIYALPE
jgi:hypothetical protein